MENNTMVMDFYELTMAYTYFKQNRINEIVYFDLFFRSNPFKGGYAISGGLDNIINYINNFKITKEDINYLRSLNKFDEDFLEYLENLKFSGDMFAIEDGTVIFPNEPIITVRANIIEAQLIETALLTNFNHGTLVTTAAKRICNAAGDVGVLEFGARRGRGEDSTVDASKYAYIGGCVATSNTKAGIKYNIPVAGTMAHSLISAANSEYDAFLEYAKVNPTNVIFLVDTYDTLKSGIPNAIKVVNDYLIPNGYTKFGIRIDSGDLAYHSKEARKMLDENGFYDATICLSNGLDEEKIISLKEQEACINSLGIGDNISAAKERVNGVYKLVCVEKDDELIPKIKVSSDTVKTINPGYKKVYRFYDKDTNIALGDVIALYDELIPHDKYTLVNAKDRWKTKELSNYIVKELQVPIFKKGVQVYELPSIEDRKKYCEKQFETIYEEIKRRVNPHEYYVDLTNRLLDLKNELIEQNVNTKKRVKKG